MSELLIPDGTLSNQWTISGAASAHLAIDEGTAPGDGETTYLSTTTIGHVAEVSLSAPTLGVAHRGDIHILFKWRLAGFPANGSSIRCELVEGGIVRYTEAFSYGLAGTGNYELIDRIVPYAQASQILDLTDVSMRFIAANVISGEEIRLTAAELQVPNVLIPANLFRHCTRQGVQVLAANPPPRITRQGVQVLGKAPVLPRATRQAASVMGRNPGTESRRASRQATQVLATNPKTDDRKVTRQAAQVLAKNPKTDERQVTRQGVQVLAKNPLLGIGRNSRQAVQVLGKVVNNGERRSTRQGIQVLARRAGAAVVVPLALPATLPNLFWANWIQNVRLDSAYSTDVIQSPMTVSEERRSLKSRPDRVVTAQLTGFREGELAKLQQNITAAAHRRFPIPLFSESVSVVTHDGSATIFCAPRYRRIFKGGRVVIANFGQFNRAIDVLYRTIVSIDDDRLVLDSATTTVYKPGARIAPCMDVEIALEYSLNHPSGIEGDASLAFREVSGPSALLPSTVDDPDGYQYHEGYPIFDLALDVGAVAMRTGIRRAGAIVPLGRGVVVSLAGERPQFTTSLPLTLMTRAQFWKLLQLFDSRRGRAKAFWLVAPIRPWEAVAIATTHVDIATAGNLQDVSDFVDHVGVRLINGIRYIREVLTVTLESGIWRITFVDPIPSITLAEIRQVAPADLVRFDDDVLSEEWESFERCRTVINTVGLLEEKEITVSFADVIQIIGDPETIQDLYLWNEASAGPFNVLTVGGPFGPQWVPAAPFPGTQGASWQVKQWVDKRASTLTQDPLGFPRISSSAYGGALIVPENAAVNNGQRTVETIAIAPPNVGSRFYLNTGGVKPWGSGGLTIFICGFTPFDVLLELKNSCSQKVFRWSGTELVIYTAAGVAQAQFWVSALTSAAAVPATKPTTMAMSWSPGAYTRVYKSGVLIGAAAQAPSTLATDAIADTQGSMFQGFYQTFTGTPVPTKDAALGSSSFWSAALIYSRALTAAEMNSIGNYLKERYSAPWAQV